MLVLRDRKGVLFEKKSPLFVRCFLGGMPEWLPQCRAELYRHSGYYGGICCYGHFGTHRGSHSSKAASAAGVAGNPENSL